MHTFRVKEMTPILWRKAGADLPVRIVVIAPVGYRLRKGGKLLYRQPAYLLCTDLDLPIEEVLQDYPWRWDIEVDLRDLKGTLGLEVLKSKQMTTIQKGVLMFVLVHNLVRLVMIEAAHRQRVKPHRISFIDAWRWLQPAKPFIPLPK